MTVKYVRTDEENTEFRRFLEQLKESGFSYDAVIENSNVIKVYARMVDDGNWKRVKYGRLVGTKVVSYIEVVYKPRIVDGKFIYNYNGKIE